MANRFLAISLLVVAASAAPALAADPPKPAAVAASAAKAAPVKRVKLTVSAEEKARVMTAVDAAAKAYAVDKDVRKATVAPSALSQNGQRLYALASRRAVATKLGKLKTATLAERRAKVVVTTALVDHWARTQCSASVGLDLRFTNVGNARSDNVTFFTSGFDGLDIVNMRGVPPLTPQETTPTIRTPNVSSVMNGSGNCDNATAAVAYILVDYAASYVLEWDKGTFNWYEYDDYQDQN